MMFARRCCRVFTFLIFASSMAGTAYAQSLTYDVLLNLDSAEMTGCSVIPVGGSMQSGFERRLRATVDANTLQATDVELQICDGVIFQPVSPSGGSYPLGLNTGMNGGDVVEMAVSRAALNANNAALIELAFVANSDAGSDVLATRDGSAEGVPIVFGLPFQVPALSVSALMLLAGALVLIAWLAHRRLGKLGAVSVVLLVSAAAWAINFAADGDVGDWAGQPPNATDPNGDASDGSSALDIVAGFAALENEVLFFRIDVADLENQAPVVVDDAFSTDEDSALNEAAPGVLANDSDADMDPITAVLDTSPSNAASFALNADGSFDYTPSADFNGTDAFTYVANDASTDSGPATVTITLNPVNDPPVTSGDGFTTDEDVPLDVNAPGVLGNDTDADDDPLTAILISAPANAQSFALNADGSFSYAPNADFNGIDSFTYAANDGTVDSNTVTVDLTVNPVNDPPVAVSDSFVTAEDTLLNSAPASVLDNDNDVESDPLTPVPDPPVAVDDTASTGEDTPTSVDVTANDLDPDGDLLNVVALGGSPLGSVMINGNKVDYDPNGQFESLAAAQTDTDTFTYTIEDATMNQRSATVTVTITGVNDDPVMALPSTPATYVEGASPSIIDSAATLTDVDSADLNGGTLTIALISNATMDDRLAINSEVPPNPPGTGLEITGSDILLNGALVGSFSGGTDGSTPLVISFTTAAATPAAAETILRNITFQDQAVPATYGTRTLSAVMTDGDGGTSASVTQDIEVVPPIACDGTVFANFCWWLGNGGESCDAVCADNGGNDPLGTTDFAGSGGTNQNCGDVMTALNTDTGEPSNPTPVTNQTGALGCASDFESVAFTIRYTDETSASATGVSIRRACACNDQLAPVSITYPGAPYSLPRGVAIADIVPDVNGFVASYAIAPALPSGLNFDTGTGVISSTPTVAAANASYTVTVTNAGGMVTHAFMLEVVPRPPANLDYPGVPFLFNLNNAVTPQLPTFTGQVDSFSIAPPLPTGLSFNTMTGEISGT